MLIIVLDKEREKGTMLFKYLKSFFYRLQEAFLKEFCFRLSVVATVLRAHDLFISNKIL